MTSQYQRKPVDQTTCLGLPVEFIREYPNVKPERANKYWLRYLSAIRAVLLKQSIYGRSAVFSVSLEEMFNKCSTFQYNGVRTSIWQTFHRLCPILMIVNKGNNMTHKLSEVRVSEAYMDMLINTAAGSDIIGVWFGDLDADKTNIDYIPIDITGLRHFIANTAEELGSATVEAHITKLEHNLSRAKQIAVVSDYLLNAGEVKYNCWPHAANPSPYGRVYYHGLNLQNCSKELRRAALGAHYQYDLVAAVYAIKLMIAEEVATERGESLHGRFVNTKEYLDYKNPIRNRLAGHITAYPEPLKLVKQALTALGFGARLQSSSWVDSEYVRQYGLEAALQNDKFKYGALSTIIKNKDDCRRFIHDPWVVQFVREQQQLTEYIVSHWLQNNDFADSIRDIPGMLTPTGKFKKNQVMCYLFQRMESQIMDTVIAELKIPVVVRIHDAFVTYKRINMIELRSTLNSISPYLHVEQEIWNEFRMDDYSGEVAEHEARMSEQQQTARAWALRTGRPITEHHTVKSIPYIKHKTEYYDGCYYEQESADE